MPAPVYVGPIVTPNNPPINFENILDYRAGIGGGGIYDSLMGGFVPDLNTVDVGVSGSVGTEEEAAAAQEAIIQDYIDSLLADRLTPMKPLTPEQRAAAEQAIKEGLRGFEYDPNKDKSAPQQLQEFLGNVNDTFRELTRDGVIRPEQAAKFIEGMLEAEGVTNKSGGAVTIDPSDWINRGIDYGTRTGANGALAYPDLSSLDSGGTPSAADVLGGVGSVIGSILTGGSSGSSGSNQDGSSGSTGSPTAPMTPDTEHPWIFDGEKLTNVFTGEVITEGDFSNLEAGQRYSYTAPDTTIKTPDVTIPPIIPVPTPSTPTTPTTPVVPTPTPTEVIPPVPPTPTPPTTPPVIVPPAPLQEVLPDNPTVVDRFPERQPGSEGETGAETAPGSVDATDPDVTDPGDTGDGDDDTGDEGDGTGDGTGDGDGDGNGDGTGIDLGGLFSSVSPTPIVDDIFAIEKFKLTRPSLDITNTLFGGFRR